MRRIEKNKFSNNEEPLFWVLSQPDVAILDHTLNNNSNNKKH